MAITILSGNLNLYGNAGNFETDPSTWGFLTGAAISRSNLVAHKNSNSCLFTVQDGGINPGFGSIPFVAKAKFHAAVGKKYYIKCYVKTSAGFPLAGLTSYQFFLENLPTHFVDEVSVNKTIVDTNAAWALIELYMTADVLAGANEEVLVRINIPDDESFAGGKIWADELEIYEYEDVVVDPSTLAIDKPSSTITDASGPVATDGFIEVAITGGTGPFEYSKDNGATWQGDDQFAGLAPGNYQVKVREVATPANVASDIFTVGYEGAEFDFTTTITNESITGAADGKILINVAGDGAPFTYAIQNPDLPAVYQASNLFENLLPGGYDVFAKDTDGNVVQHYALIAAGDLAFDKIYWSKNPVTFNKAAAPDWEELINFRLYDDVRVEDESGSGEFISKLKTDLPPDVDGNVVFLVRQAFRNIFTITPPTYQANDTSKRLTDRIKTFKHYTGQLQDDEVVPAELNASLPSLVLYGGLSKYAWPLLDFFGAQTPAGQKYLATRKMFLTWAPITKPVSRSQEDYLNYLVFKTGVTQLNIKFTAYYDDNSSENDTEQLVPDFNSYGTLWQIPVGPANSLVLLINPEKNLISYTVQIFDQDNVAISELRTFLLDLVPRPRARYFMFLNSMGTFEVIRFTGVTEYSSEINKEQIVKFLSHDYSALQGEREVNSATLQRLSNNSSGYIDGAYAAEWLDYMDEFLISPRVFEVTDRQRRPVLVNGGSFNKGADQSYERFIRLTTVDAYQDDSYTPQNL